EGGNRAGERADLVAAVLVRHAFLQVAAGDHGGDAGEAGERPRHRPPNYAGAGRREPHRDPGGDRGPRGGGLPGWRGGGRDGGDEREDRVELGRNRELRQLHLGLPPGIKPSAGEIEANSLMSRLRYRNVSAGDRWA